MPDHSFDTSDEEWRYATDLNLNSAIRFTRAVVPHMRAAGGGRIINNASVSAHTAMVGGFTTYEVTKTAMLAHSPVGEGGRLRDPPVGREPRRGTPKACRRMAAAQTLRQAREGRRVRRLPGLGESPS